MLRLRATTTTLITMAVPLVGLLASVVILGESVTPAALAGVAAIGVGVALCTVAEARPAPAAAAQAATPD